jgi:molybdopterin molybdotransferase
MDENLTNLMNVASAIDLIDRLPVTPRRIEIGLDAAAGLRLAENVKADRDYPPFDKSLVDGYAVRSADVAAGATAGAELNVVGEIAAGQTASRPIAAGEAMTIMTGAALPAGADCVVPIEQTAGTFVAVGQRVRLTSSAPASASVAAPGRNVAPRGSDTRQGTVVLASGTLIGAPQLAVAACVGATKLSVWDRPKCAVLATGNEIIPFDQTPRADQLRNSNSLMLMALLKRLGCAVRDLGTASDTPEKIKAAIHDGLNDDAIFVTGGMSMGKFDYVPQVLRELSGELKITKLRIKPGKPFVVAAMPGGKYVFGLPGNPVSALVCTVRLASRLLCRLGGGMPRHQIAVATLSAPLAENGPREFYLPGVLEGGHIRPLEWKGSADLFTLAAANALIIRPENAPATTVGGSVPIMELP